MLGLVINMKQSLRGWKKIYGAFKELKVVWFQKEAYCFLFPVAVSMLHTREPINSYDENGKTMCGIYDD